MHGKRPRAGKGRRATGLMALWGARCLSRSLSAVTHAAIRVLVCTWVTRTSSFVPLGSDSAKLTEFSDESGTDKDKYHGRLW